MNKKYILLESAPTNEEYMKLRKAVGWGDVDADAVKTGWSNSLFSVCVMFENEVIGCGRVIGDGGIYFYIQDVIILPEFQRQGIGEVIMNSLMEYLKANAHAEAFIGLMAAKESSEFYKQFGFKERPFDAPLSRFQPAVMIQPLRDCYGRYGKKKFYSPLTIDQCRAILEEQVEHRTRPLGAFYLPRVSSRRMFDKLTIRKKEIKPFTVFYDIDSLIGNFCKMFKVNSPGPPGPNALDIAFTLQKIKVSNMSIDVGNRGHFCQPVQRHLRTPGIIESQKYFSSSCARHNWPFRFCTSGGLGDFYGV
jgi:GNAT superfamily N-acetyltransferase